MLSYHCAALQRTDSSLLCHQLSVLSVSLSVNVHITQKCDNPYASYCPGKVAWQKTRGYAQHRMYRRIAILHSIVHSFLFLDLRVMNEQCLLTYLHFSFEWLSEYPH